MNSGMHDVKRRVDHVEVPPPDVAGLVEAGERRLRRRRLAAVAGAAAVIVAVGVGVTTWTQIGGSREPADLTIPGSSPDAVHPEPTRIDQLPYGPDFAPGLYALPARGGPDLPLAVVDLPAGFHHGEADDILSSPRGAMLAAWNVTRIYRDPCTKAGGLRDPGGTVDDLATALASQAIFSPTTPAAVSIGGRPGVYLEMTAPDIDLEQCTNGDVAFWRSTDAVGDLWSDVPGTTVGVWILDVDGSRVVLNTYAEPDTGKRDIDALTVIVESAQFVSPGS